MPKGSERSRERLREKLIEAAREWHRVYSSRTIHIKSSEYTSSAQALHDAVRAHEAALAASRPSQAKERT